MLFKKDLHLKRRTKEILEVLPAEYGFDDFLQAFIDCYPAAWEDIINYCTERRSDFYRRRNKGLRTVPFYSPPLYLKRNCGWNRRRIEVLSDGERQNRYNKLVEKGQKKKSQRDTRIMKNLERVQEVTPSYVRDLITAYFQTREKDTLNINARYLILLEASQFHSKETIEFLHCVATCDKNDELRDIAYQSLVRMGEHPWKVRKRKGRQKASQLKRIDLQKNPTELLQLIYINQQVLYQSYDVFLSHSSLDVKELLELKQTLNKQNLVVYIDWINDEVMLNRPNQNEDTWNALELRMRQSKMLLYVMTDNSICSPYTEREVNYFKSLSKRVVVYQPHGTTLTKPEYIKNCESLNLEQLRNISNIYV
ncbi:MAG: toll/interleukin-1 receptor domain-containing protein [Bacteroidales bacterium]|nr:toll/interleukin-1 receptor domain-containing protein [Bacteroidales bacterium]